MTPQAGIPMHPVPPAGAAPPPPPAMGIVLAVYYADDLEAQRGRRTRQVLCDVALVRGGFLPRVPVLQHGYSITNGSLWVPSATVGTVSGAPLRLVASDEGPATFFDDLDGECVLVQYIHGARLQPVIVGALPHPATQRLQGGHDPAPLPTYTPGEAERLQAAPSGSESWLAHQGVVARVDRAGNLRVDLEGAGVANDGRTPADGAAESDAVAAAGASAAVAAGVAAGAAAGAKAGTSGGNATSAARSAARVVARKAARAAKIAARAAELAGQAVEAAQNAPDLVAAAALAAAEQEAALLVQLATDAARAKARDLLALEYEGGAGAGAALGAAAGAEVAAEVAAETPASGVGWIDLNLKAGAMVLIRSGGVPVFVLTAEADGQVVLDVGKDAAERAVLGERLMALFDGHRHLDAFGMTGPVVPADRMSTAQGDPLRCALSERVRLPAADQE